MIYSFGLNDLYALAESCKQDGADMTDRAFVMPPDVYEHLVTMLLAPPYCPMCKPAEALFGYPIIVDPECPPDRIEFSNRLSRGKHRTVAT